MSDFEGLDVCHKFMSETVTFIGPSSRRRFFSVSYFVCDEEFVIKVDYDKDRFEHLIQEYACKILEELRNNKFHRYIWAVHRPLCENIRVSDNYFLYCALVKVPRE